MRLVLLFTTFPVPTETFLQREVTALRRRSVDLELWSLWGGEASFEGMPVRRIPWWHLLGLLFWLPWWLVVRPRAMSAVLRNACRARWRNPTNYGENLLGLGLGVVHARAWARRDPEVVLHAVWASLPAAFGWTVAQLTGTPFTFAAHAYDLFEDGGDGWLPEKIAAARWIRTSTEAGQRRLLAAGADPARVALIRRGLAEWPPGHAARSPRRPVRLLQVGRFVPKMGYPEWLEILGALAASGLPFEARVIGDGPTRVAFERTLARQPWRDRVSVLGARPFDAVARELAWCDVVTFTGVVAPSGDQAGFPNILGEAMAAGRPVVATPVGAVPEVIEDGVNGALATTPETWPPILQRLATDDAHYAALARAARTWAEAAFSAEVNMARFEAALASALRTERPG